MSAPTRRFHARVTELLADALELPEADRIAHVRDAAAGDEELEREVLSLLMRTDDAEIAVGLPLPRTEPLASSADLPGYRVIRVIGEGGMGTVYEAEQLEPSRRVALKVIRGFSASQEALRRFRREADLLAQLQHPSICQVYEVGRTAGGQPFLSMELVDGRSLTRFADEEGLGRSERLALICLVCDAVAHAHDRGIVHRDLKPDNVLVTADGRPKVLDFGIARVTQPGHGASMLTGTGSILGTLSYMSPEQAAGERQVDCRSDVYSLGVMAFELLTGRLPIELGQLSLPQALHQVQQADISLAGKSEPSLKGDPATILGKALEREPHRRYATAGEMAADIRRHFAHEPVLAQPPSIQYRVAKFTRKHRTVVTAAALVFAALITGFVVAVHEAREAREAERLAEARREISERQAYRAGLVAASSAMQADNRASALRELEAAPEDLRGWEWRYLHSLVDTSSGSVSLGRAGGVIGLAMAEDGSRAYVALRQEGVTHDAFVVSVLVPAMELERTFLVRHGEEQVVLPRDAVRTVLGILQKRESTVTILEPETGRVLLHVTPCEGGFTGVRAPSASGDLRLVAVGVRGTSSEGVCELETGRLLHRDASMQIRGFDPSGKRLLSVSSRLGVRDAQTGTVIWQTDDEPGTHAAATFSADGRKVFSSGYGPDAPLRTYDAATGRLLWEGRIDGVSIGFQAWAVAGDRAALAPGDDSIRVYDGSLSRSRSLSVPQRGAWMLAMTPDGSRLLAVNDFAVRRGADPLPLQWHDLRADRAGLGQSWVARHERTGQWDPYVYDACLTPDLRRVVSVGWDERVRVWDAGSASALAVGPLGGEPTGVKGFRALGLTSDGSTAITVAGDGSIVAMDTWTGRSLASARLSGGGGNDLAVHPFLDLVAVAGTYADGGAGTVEIRRASDLSLVRRDDHLVDAVAWSPDGRRLAAAHREHHGIVVDADTLEPLVALAGSSYTNTFSKLGWSPDGTLIVSAATELLVHDASTGRLVHRLADPGSGRELDAVFTADGRRIVSGADDGALRVWDVATGELLLRLPAHERYIASVRFDVGGNVLATGSGDGSVRLWDARTLTERAERESEEHRLEREMAPVVDGYFTRLGQHAAVIEALRSDATLGEDERNVALLLALRRAEGIAASGSR